MEFVYLTHEEDRQLVDQHPVKGNLLVLDIGEGKSGVKSTSKTAITQ